MNRLAGLDELVLHALVLLRAAIQVWRFTQRADLNKSHFGREDPVNAFCHSEAIRLEGQTSPSISPKVCQKDPVLARQFSIM